MQKLKQTIILSGEGNEVATLSLEKNGNGIIGNLKLFNANFKDDLMLGLSSNGNEIFKQNVSFLNGNTYTFKINNFNSLENLGCVLVQKKDNKYVPLLWGKKHDVKDKILAEFNDSYLSGINNNLPKSEDGSNLKNNENLYSSSDEEIENLINEELKDIKDLNLDSVLASNYNGNIERSQVENLNEINNVEISKQSDFEDELKTKISNGKDIFFEENKKLGDFNGNEFFDLISEQIDDLFDNYPRLDELEELIPNSKWVKIDFENNGNEYVLGLIYDGFDLKYICYGVPGTFNSEPPKQLGECQWLPLNPKSPSDGYWVIYQDANTGEKVDVI